MADEKPSLHVDTDWKRQAQEEKKRLAEQEAAAKPAPQAATAPAGAAAAAAEPEAAERGAAPEASFSGLVQSLLTQVLFYLGDIAPRGGQPMLNLDMAKHNIDLLNVLESKTVNNLNPDEKRLLDAALYEARMRYVAVASQFIG